jgi:hypothetical protein
MTDTPEGNSTPPLANLTLEEIAASFIMLVPSCLTLNHQTIQGTLTYVHPSPGSAAAFVKDVLTRSPGEVARKWYGSEHFAKLMATRAVSDALFGDEPAA